MKTMETSTGQWPDPSLIMSNQFDTNKPSTSSPARSCYQTTSSPSRSTGPFHMSQVHYTQPTKTSRLFKRDDGSDTSDTTGSQEGRRGRHHSSSPVEECEVEVVAMDELSKVVMAQDGAVESCHVVETPQWELNEPSSEFNTPDDSNNKSKSSEATLSVPDRQKSAMNAFLASPTNLNWDDLVRSMREEMFVNTVTIKRNKSDDSSSTGSLGSNSKGCDSSMGSSLSSKSIFLRKRRAKIKGGPVRNRRRKQRETLEKRIERVVASGERINQYHDEEHPLSKGKVVGGGKRCAFSAVTKLPCIPCSPGTPLKENGRKIIKDSGERDGTWFNPEQQPVSQKEELAVVTPDTVGTSRPSQEQESETKVQESPAQTEPNVAKLEDNEPQIEDPPLLLKLSISADSDEDSFYYHIRGKPAPKLDTPSTRPKSGTKVKAHKNPYAFSNHPLLTPVMEEGNIPPFPTTFDELDGQEDEQPSTQRTLFLEEESVVQSDVEESPGQALGSFAASIGIVESSSSSHQARLNTYKSTAVLASTKPRRRRKKSIWHVLAPCCRRTKAEI